ncbi:MAG TPA: SRPBCC domain-containing protein, partial [Burkholderiales bacterium]|nr:SRPBCC domain-containing protein [Burkholderiales bacterium]
MSKHALNAARAVADLSAGSILATVEIAAPPERVFRALTSGEEIVRWWGSDGAYRTTAWQVDLRPGGAWRADGKGADGTTFSVGGRIVEVDPPRKLVQTWKSDWDPGPETTVTFRIDPIDGGTRLTLRHDGFVESESCRSHSDGWQQILGWLVEHLRGR